MTPTRIFCFIICFIFLLTCTYSRNYNSTYVYQKIFSQQDNMKIPYREAEKDYFSSSASIWFDVKYYKLELNINTAPNYLNGKVTISGACLDDSARVLLFDLRKNMQIDSIMIAGKVQNFIQYDNHFEIHLDCLLKKNDNLSVEIYYQGLPIPTGFGSFIFDSHNNIPWVYSLSQPFGAKDWWPCKDDPSDKADSADIIITCNSNLKAGSQGILVEVKNNGDGTSSYHWKTRYPIASYLISVAITNYAQFSNWFKYTDTDSMEILNYILPEHYDAVQQSLPLVVDMLEIYSRLFGLYPFIEEKYGHAEIGRGGAMEHQTMTSTTTFNEEVLAHELAHQWFGNMITCRTWDDLWLNEGFAQYCTALYYEKKYGKEHYWQYMNSQMSQAMLAHGVIGIADFSSERALFDVRRIYAKGACVLHMLRHVIGDSIFFTSLHNYANSPTLKYSTATINDFQTICENISGQDLSYFFQQWIYGEGYPKYSYTWTWNPLSSNPSITIRLRQTQNNMNPEFFTMPIDIKIVSKNKDTVITIWNNSQYQTFIIPYPEKPINIILDPEEWILKYAFMENILPPRTFILEQNYPNPFNSSTKIIIGLPAREHVSLKIYDILGREIVTLVNGIKSAGFYEYEWDALNYASGIYIYRLITETSQLSKIMLLIK